MTEEFAQLLLMRHGDYLFHAELYHLKVMQEAKAENRALRAQVLSMGVHPSCVLLEVELMRQPFN